MRASVVFATVVMLMLGFASPSRAGLLELPFDHITRHHNCDIEPCRGNHLAYKEVYVRDRYLRFDIHTQPARYEMRRVRVMVAPPTIVMTHSGYDSDRVGRHWLVELPVGHYRTVKAAQYAWVMRPVLVHPARNWVTRRHPHSAYYPETITVYQN